MDAARIIEDVKAAFPSRRPGQFQPLVNSVQGDEPAQVEADFLDKEDWTLITPGWINMVADEAALIFLSDEAICFYIPAYLVADLSGELASVDPTFILTHGFDDGSLDQKYRPRDPLTATDDARQRWDRLTPEQASSIARYLEWRVARDGARFSQPLVQALRNYWYERASGRRHLPLTEPRS